MELKYQTGLKAHCQRVAAYCDEIATSMGLPSRARSQLQRFALDHHSATSELPEEALYRILADCNGVSQTIRHVSDCGIDGDSEKGLSSELALVLEAADLLDEALEFAPLGEINLTEILNRNPEQNPAISLAMGNLRQCSPLELIAAIRRLPVCPAKAVEALRLLRAPNASLDCMVRIALGDQMLTGSILRAANAAAYARTTPATNVMQAAAFIGTDLTARVLLTAAMKPLLAAPGMEALWRHSVEAAQVAEVISLRSGIVSAADAYVVGLLHDVGKLLLRLLPPRVGEKRERLIGRGVPSSIAEVITCGMEHAEAGAEVLRCWGMPEEFIAAVKFHHEPERVDSNIAALLYLVEFWTDCEEDLPSNARLHCALQRTGMTIGELQQLQLPKTNISSVA